MRPEKCKNYQGNSWFDAKEIAANKEIQSFRNSSKSRSHITDCPLETKEQKFK